MSEFESAILIVLIVLVILIFWTVLSSRSDACSNKLAGVEWFADKRTDLPVDSEIALLATSGYQELLNTTAVDPSTRSNHREYVNESLGKVSGASKATVFDHDLNSNWVGLKRPKNVTPADDALQQYSANDGDFTKGVNLRWD